MKIHQIRHENEVKTKSAEREKSSLLKESVKNAELYKPVLNKIMTKHE